MKSSNGLKVICMAALALTACSSGDGPPVNDIIGDPAVTFAASTYSVDEGAGVAVTVQLSDRSIRPLNIPFTISGTGGASDYSALPNPLTVPAGDTSATFIFATVADTADEPNETIVLTIGSFTGGHLGATTTTTITIVDDDVTPGNILGRVTDAVTGTALDAVAAAGGGLSTTSSSTGAYSLTPVATSGRIIATFRKDGFAPQSRTTEAFSSNFVETLVNVPMAAVALVDTFDSANARTISVPSSPAQLVVPAGALRTTGGAAPSSMATARVAPMAPGSNVGVLPGNYLAGNVPFETFGALDVQFVDASGGSLGLAAGTNMTVRIPVSTRSSARPATTTFYYFDPPTGAWVAAGTATLLGTAPNQYYEGTTTTSLASTSFAAGVAYNTVSVTGCVQSASGAPIADAVLTAEGTNYSGTTSAVTNASGMFTVSVKASSGAFLQASKGTSISNSPPITTQTANITLTTCLVLTPNTVSVKLTWGDQPEDLDSHTLGANSTDHIFYAAKGLLNQLPFVALDVDDITGNGPEVTTFANLAQNKTYRFYVHNYSETFNPGQTTSPARVEITYNGIQRVFTPPATGETAQTFYWHVFDMTTDSSCAPTIVPVNVFTIAEPVNANVGNSAVFCN